MCMHISMLIIDFYLHIYCDIRQENIVLGKSLFEFFHNILWKNMKGLLANPVLTVVSTHTHASMEKRPREVSKKKLVCLYLLLEFLNYFMC